MSRWFTRTVHGRVYALESSIVTSISRWMLHCNAVGAAVFNELRIGGAAFRRRTNMTRSAAFIAVCLASTVPAFAHHGAGTFDLSKSVTYTGKLTKIELINPHSWLYFDVTDPTGRVSHHRCEMRSVHVLRRSGWSKELFPVGHGI